MVGVALLYGSEDFDNIKASEYVLCVFHWPPTCWHNWRDQIVETSDRMCLKGTSSFSAVIRALYPCIISFSLLKLLRCAGSNDAITFRADENGGDTLMLIFESPSPNDGKDQNFVSVSKCIQLALLTDWCTRPTNYFPYLLLANNDQNNHHLV
jgi:hypothetical protein